MPVVEYGKDDDELLNQPMKHEMSEETDGYSVIVTVPSNTSHCSLFLCRQVKMFFCLKPSPSGSLIIEC